jgi:hypothetical protein
VERHGPGMSPRARHHPPDDHRQKCADQWQPTTLPSDCRY